MTLGAMLNTCAHHNLQWDATSIHHPVRMEQRSERLPKYHTTPGAGMQACGANLRAVRQAPGRRPRFPAARRGPGTQKAPSGAPVQPKGFGPAIWAHEKCPATLNGLPGVFSRCCSRKTAGLIYTLPPAFGPGPSTRAGCSPPALSARPPSAAKAPKWPSGP